ncbi:type IV pilin protein [Thioalkalivibrio sp. ALE19]|uniref:type IV pilin protein n=1 Tax=Thioalkalivibrio sp. ALE19 TaxID=1266909 RepID=UPI0003FFD7C4|nr:type IV pilin protein [Thioalkalivibrio sp. ALE19]
MRRQTGFTLIELMIVVAVIAIIAAIAYPAYLDQVRKAHRGDAQTALMQYAQALERCYTQYNAYDADDCPDAPDIDRYTIDDDDIDAREFTLTANPDSTGGQNQDACGWLQIDHLGRRTADGDNCWD